MRPFLRLLAILHHLGMDKIETMDKLKALTKLDEMYKIGRKKGQNWKNFVKPCCRRSKWYDLSFAYF